MWAHFVSLVCSGLCECGWTNLWGSPIGVPLRGLYFVVVGCVCVCVLSLAFWFQCVCGIPSLGVFLMFPVI